MTIFSVVFGAVILLILGSLVYDFVQGERS